MGKKRGQIAFPARLRAAPVTTPIKAAKTQKKQQWTSGPHRRFDTAKKIIEEVVGTAPYEKRIVELLKNDFEKKALRFAKRRLGTHKRAKRKLGMIQDALRDISSR
eukprot:TRINITY_DN42473_c0_g1_i1.p1 TRINITY_DN42473_c0_g1~~TRINITY_DN42473_c0_g1_i1.p1  ORF type:complete len:106 (+),score=25.81 TRINITY_DN42473_c0_g1_i1:29-346(+)